MIVDTLYATALAGGWVMLPLFFCGAVGFYLIFSSMNRIGRDVFRRDLKVVMDQFAILMAENKVEEARAYLKRNRGLVADQLIIALDHETFSESQLRMEMTEKMTRLICNIDRGMHLAGVMATTAPLFGLLGTVAGMISTFAVLTEFGNSNPMLLADGISEALIATQSGLLIAIPLMLLQNRIEDRNNWIRKQLEHGMTIILNWANRRDNFARNS